MPVWQVLLDAAGGLLVLVLLYGIALIARRRMLSRHGGTFEVSYRVRPERAGRGWLLGLGRYSGETLEWFRIFSLSPRPKRVWGRDELTYAGRRDPDGRGADVALPRPRRDQLPQSPRRRGARDGPVLADGLPVVARVRAPRVVPAAVTADRAVIAARNAVALAFALNGFCFATLVSRIPDLRSGLDLDNGSLGLLLLAIAAGSVLALPSSGRLIQRGSAAGVVRLGAVSAAVGLLVASLGVDVWGSVPVTAVGFFAYGIGIGVWDVAMNVEGAEVERRIGRTIMPRFHAGWSLGSIAGAAVGVPMAAVDAPLSLHVGVAGVLALVAVARRRPCLPAARCPSRTPGRGRARRGGSRARWRSGSWCWPSPPWRGRPTTGSRSRSSTGTTCRRGSASRGSRSS